MGNRALAAVGAIMKEETRMYRTGNEKGMCMSSVGDWGGKREDAENMYETPEGKMRGREAD